MINVIKSHHPLRHIKSFKYAFQGIFHAFLNEPNFRVQLLIVAISTALGFYFHISKIEWGFLVLTLGMLLSAEILNTIVEEFIDNLIKEYHEGAKVIKDMSAGFVLTSAVISLVILYLVFWDKIVFSFF